MKIPPPGYVININKATGKFDLFCSVTPYGSNSDEFAKRVSLVNDLHPDSEFLCDDV